MNAEAELTDFQRNKELLNRLISIHETPFKLPQRFWIIREQEADSVPQSEVETAIANLNLGIKTRTQKAYPPQSVRKFLESVEYQRIQQSRPKLAQSAIIQLFDPDDPITWLASYPPKWPANQHPANVDTAKIRKYESNRKAIEKKVQQYTAAKKKLEHYLKLCKDLSAIDTQCVENIDRDPELVDEIHRTRELIDRLIRNLQRVPLTRSMETKEIKEVKSIDNITKGLLWQ